ncbi:MAG: hypothetical protein ABH878_01500, partial [bacterium]
MDIREILPGWNPGRVERQHKTDSPALKPNERDSGRRDSGRIEEDILDLDQKLRENVRLAENAKLLLPELPEVRTDLIEQIRQRLDAGFYDSEEVLE